MEFKTVTKEMREALRVPLPTGAVSKHPTKTFLSSIKAIYVTERLNDVFGVGSLYDYFCPRGRGCGSVTGSGLASLVDAASCHGRGVRNSWPIGIQCPPG